MVQSVSAAVDIDTMWINEIAEFKKARRKVKKKIIGEDGTITWEFYG